MFENMTDINEIKEILEVLKNIKGNIYIQMHNNPDPDALGSGLGLSYLLMQKGIRAILCYYGSFNKTNIMRMIDVFDIDAVHIDDIKDKIDKEKDYLILVDCQRAAGNVYDIGINNVIAIDHHMDLDMEYVFSDIRSDIGACSTIITEYFLENDIDIPRNIAGALLYGVTIDTNNLSRKASKLDIDIFYVLMNLANASDIAELNLSQICMNDLLHYSEGLAGVEKYDRIGFANIKDCNDALLGTIGDMIISVDGIYISVVYSKREEGVKFSVRSSCKDIYANELIQYILEGIGSGGGHKEMAGGFVAKNNLNKLKDRKLDTFIKYRTIRYIEG